MSTKNRPMMEELKKGRWPSFITEIEKSEGNEMSHELLDLLEESYERKVPLWKHGGIVGVRGYGGGVVGRYTLEPEKYPAVKEFHTMRINQPSGFFYTSDDIRTLCDIWEKHGSGLTNMHGTTGDAVFLGTTTDHLQPCFNDLSDAGWDLGGSGSNLRTPSCCVGPGRCEYACIDTLDLTYNITMEYQMELHRPMWPYKSKIKISGCPNDCVSSTARSDIAIIGTWRDAIQVDQAEVAKYADNGMPMEAAIVKPCPTQCIKYDADKKELNIDNANCNRCMHCINLMPKALKVGKEKGASILLGGKATIVQSAFIGWVVVPFMKLDKEDDYANLKEFLENLWDWWDENAKTRERLGELIYRLGMNSMLKSIGMKPVPQMVKHPRENPYIYWYGDDFENDTEVAE
ncbi:MAG: dissimilatory-type sulfite reductase subunit alpha [Clostridiales bacterium]|uniref:Dissimilatory sulfite reductase alpha subunit n=1 Tax=Peptococcus niger TaxID=2741 RepID=A0A1G6UJR7_PEPNI|nr:dissimilatory-type sulfite reductase subunit alpha [Peptococcus niger]MBS5594453.1 dissimilatory-type sulfite reductase subunit alpha [Clostridiales bacterium]MDU7504906.1 dissimilatory-type sulfite reductase subunit alpha [Clostridia bacterium]MBS5916295.1 dissimilatory-type sulfite reductase subunit alpha [Clostridiales bacterium]MDU1028193.1 dissimilatory-type sulfite reductase subunit alpha [Clostridiales bacterium]MDU2292639.1 dissimilatory-type sulfite reductase subunit alpha [Peptoco